MQVVLDFLLELGLSALAGSTITISGNATVDVSTPTIYTFTVTATGNGTCEEESFTGQIEVLPNDELTHVAAGGAKKVRLYVMEMTLQHRHNSNCF